ncbi:MFS general substrate transporter [Penicillium cosmopolitanum]|uniref:MFS general substrate transporter n=1 Tax=Penicillium cosmopolitanum TaxID=1131564 RepID=A0A9W9W0C6_9EURO|nr:MFS general substrate transporter [Penicillium cosmopolitanum]KAJ5392475.1 MFS general substrate transporter [Penicillium cosmopolitanum]
MAITSRIDLKTFLRAMPTHHTNSTSESTLAEPRPGPDVEKDDHTSPPSATEVATNEPPDGGRDAWLVTFGSWWALFIAFGWTNSLGVFQNYYEKELLRAYSASTIAWIASTQIFMMYGGGIVLGKVFDHYGPRWLLLVGGFAHVFGLIMTSISKEYYQIFLSQAICSAIGASAIYYACLGSLASWFRAKRATAFGIAASGASIGGVIFPVMVDRLIDQVGFGWTMRAVAFLILGGLVIVNLTVKSRLVHEPKPVHIRQYIKPFTEIPFLLLVISLSLFSFGLFLPFNFITAQAQTLGMSPNLANYLVAILNATSVFGRIIPGLIADRVGRFNVMSVATLVSGILTFALWLTGRSNVAIILYAAFFGFFSGAYVSLTPALIAQLSPIQEIGIRTGALYFFVSIAVLTGSPIAGALVSVDKGKYGYLEIFAGATMCAGAALVVLTRVVKGGFKWAVL